MLQLSLRKDIVLVEVPESAYMDETTCEPDEDGGVFWLCFNVSIGFNDKHVCHKLPRGSWQLVGLCSELSEEQWREIVESITWEPISDETLGFVDYEYDGDDENTFDTALESGLSLLKHHSLTPNKTILLTKK